MFSFRSLGFSIPRIPWSGGSGQGVNLPSVTIHEIEESPEKRARTVKHLIRANHINHSIIYHHLEFHNHAPHILGSAFLLGANVDQMHEIYEKESETLEPWVDAPSEISRDDWRDYLGKRNYQRAWVDFFEDQLVHLGYDWKELLFEYLFEGRNPLVNNLIAGLGHPLIHLGYALELHSPTIGIEALALVAAFYNKQHIYLDEPSYTKPPPWTSHSPLEILDKMQKDARFDSLRGLSAPGGETYEAISHDTEAEALLLEYWNSLTISDLPSQFKDAQNAAISLLLGSHKAGQKFDFFLVHALTSSHALRIILPMIPKKWHIPLFRQWWLFVVNTYIAQQRPLIDVSKITSFDRKGKDWKYVDDVAVNGDWRLDAHFVKGLRAMKVLGQTYGHEEEEFALKAAVSFAEAFEGWGGFGAMTTNEVEAVEKKTVSGEKHGVGSGF